ncbi:MAG: hypothetical protein KatS3mg022_0765 [Armatimonadota bacterium]|nr:MAG: hypothetical protein KatS3mg022_0765 [Armatimonadota bacterium]
MHLPEIAMEEALQEGECALCWLAHQHLLRQVDTLLSEHVNDPQWRQSLREGNGFCAYHAELVLSRASVLSLAIIAEDVLAHTSIAPATKRASVGWHCQLCEAQVRDVAQMTKLLAELLHQAEWRTRYERSSGLCLPHLRQVLRSASPEVQKWIVANENHRWQILRAQLQEVIRKHDYRFQHEPWGEEVGSWRRAMRKIYGVFAKEVHHER